MSDAAADPRIERAVRRSARLADLLDTRFRLPGTNFRFGIDPLISLVPVAGDTLALILGLYPVMEALRLRLGAGLVARMLLNLGIDWLVGLVPLLGLIPDAIYKANAKNARLLQAALELRIEGSSVGD